MSDKGEYIHITRPLISKNMHLFPLEQTHSYQLVQGKACVGVCVPLDLVDVLGFKHGKHFNMQIMDPTQKSYSNSKKQQNSGYTISDVCDVK